MVLPQIKNEKYSYADYLTWNDNERWEIIDGFAYNMSPAPNTKHQTIAVNIASAFHSYLKGKPCKVFPAPFDVRLAKIGAPDEEIETVVQPDISIFCNPMKLDEKGAKGAPDLVVEILSPSTSKKDMGVKTLLYQRYGVREYWIVDPVSDTIMVYLLDNSEKFNLINEYKTTDKITVSIFPDLDIELSDVFEN